MLLDELLNISKEAMHDYSTRTSQYAFIPTLNYRIPFHQRTQTPFPLREHSNTCSEWTTRPRSWSAKALEIFELNKAAAS
jgi:hypothetical protein